MSNNLFPSTINSEEETCGFQVQDIKNPRGGYAFQPSTIQAVVIYVGQSDRVIKMSQPDNDEPIYKHQRYGIWAFEGASNEPDWLPVGDLSYEDPTIAVQRATAMLGKETDPKILTRIP